VLVLKIVILFAHIGDALRGGDAGVIDENIYGADFCLSMRHRSFDTHGIGHIECHHMRTAAFSFNIGA
jgi:hypothetical protein